MAAINSPELLPKTREDSIVLWRKLKERHDPADWYAILQSEYEKCHDYLYWRWSGHYAFTPKKGSGTLAMPLTDYEWVICSLLENRTVRHKAWPKSRQMLLSWELSAYYVWYAQFHPDTENLVVNKKDEDSAYIVSRGTTNKGDKRDKGRGRCWTLYRNQPDWLKEMCGASTSYNRIDWDNGACIQGLPEGEEQLHQWQASNTWFDEASRMNAFAARFFGGAMPMSENIHVTSTPDQPMDDFCCIVLDKTETEMQAN